MLDPSKLPHFLIASLILLLTPGPTVLYIIARSVAQGRADAGRKQGGLPPSFAV
ncbi:MAG: hypothetical protein HYZ49_21530 [Chloroflexi bacterium]|nr:hypothetical protein [Chloroflexota bacterium]